MAIKKKSNVEGLFGGGNEPLTFETADHEIYGVPGQGPSEGKSIQRIPIFDITPDPVQPRRAMPSAVRQGWKGDPNELSGIFDRWLALATDERRSPFPIRDYLPSESDSSQQPQNDSQNADEEAILRSEQMGPIETSLMEIVDLAVSIRRDTLLNPITVAGDKNSYQLETGERRWLAFHLLNHFAHQNGNWLRISAVVVQRPNVWRQAAENNARADLNAIGKARQFAILLMDLLRKEGHTFEPMSAFDNERDFYAQVADGEQFRIPRGKSEMLLNATGLSTGQQLRQMRRLLSLPNAVWTIVDDYNWTESKIRALYERAKDDAELYSLVMKQIDDDTAPIGAVSSKSSPQMPHFLSPKVAELLRPLNRIDRVDIQKLANLKEEERDQALAYLATCHDRIHELELILRTIKGKNKR